MDWTSDIVHHILHVWVRGVEHTWRSGGLSLMSLWSRGIGHICSCGTTSARCLQDGFQFPKGSMVWHCQRRFRLEDSGRLICHPLAQWRRQLLEFLKHGCRLVHICRCWVWNQLLQPCSCAVICLFIRHLYQVGHLVLQRLDATDDSCGCVCVCFSDH